MSKRVIIATGGTGGHVYPAIALAQQLLELPDCQVLFIGGGLSENRYFDAKTFDSRSVSCGAFLNNSPKSILHALTNIGKGVWQSRRIIKEFKPDVAVGFGSFYAFPPLIAAKLLGVPLVLHEANSIPGKVNRLLAPFAEIVGVHFPETVHLLKGKTIEVGMPLRKGFRSTGFPASEARKHFGLLPDRTTLLIFGGSQGARSINALVYEALKQLETPSLLQVLHLTGDPQMAIELQQNYQKHGIHACVKAFETNMHLAWQAADCVICRSGAGTIAEQLEFEVPGLLIPYPRAADNHQEHNADFMVATVCGAVKLHEKGLEASRLKECLSELMKNNGALLEAMKQSIKSYKRRSRTKDLFSLVNELF